MMFNSLDIAFIRGDIRGRQCKMIKNLSDVPTICHQEKRFEITVGLILVHDVDIRVRSVFLANCICIRIGIDVRCETCICVEHVYIYILLSNIGYIGQ